MANYIWSDANRFYAATESAYGTPAPVTASNRLAAVRLQCHQSVENTARKDKTGSRTYRGSAPTATHVSNFELYANLTSWDDVNAPCYGPLVQAAMGAPPEVVQGLAVAAANGTLIQTQEPHNLSAGSAISSGGEIRFVTLVQDSLTVSINVAFSVAPVVGDVLATTIGYKLATRLSSVSLYDYWNPASAVSRLIAGAGVDKFQIDVKGDVHSLYFSGPAADILDSCSSVFGSSGLTAFPNEPAISTFSYAIVPGQLGQVWLGSPLNQVFTLTEAAIEIRNNLLVRNQEFGSAYPKALVPGPREVISNFTLFAQADTNAQSLYAAAKARTPVSALLQLGRQQGQIMAVYLPNVVPELPLFNDSEVYLFWEFNGNFAQGVSNDEVYIAFA